MEEDLYDDEACDACVYVEETGEGFRVSLDIPASLMGYIVGKKGETRKRIEEETNTHVRIPKQGEEGLVGEWLRIRVILFSEQNPYMHASVHNIIYT